MKKKVLFVCYGLGIGGIEKCLVNLINILSEDKYEVDILLMNPEYELKNQIRRKVEYIKSFQYVLNTTDAGSYVKKNLKRVLPYIFFRMSVKIKRTPWKTFKPLEKTYDVAIAYSQNDYSPYYVTDKVKAKRKVMWYHNGVYEKSKKQYETDKKYYHKFDYVVAVSSDCRKVLSDKFSFEDDKLIVLKNIYDIENILESSKKFKPASYASNKVNIATVARLTEEKGIDIAIKACKKLIEKGYDVIWHWIGDGNQHQNAEELILSYGLGDNFILEKNQLNPYPFIQYCDIYVQPSYYEAYSTTITEARILKKPIVTTDVGGMRDQIIDNCNGIITDVNDIAITEAIMKLIDDDNFRGRIVSNIYKSDISNEDELKQYENTVFL